MCSRFTLLLIRSLCGSFFLHPVFAQYHHEVQPPDKSSPYAVYFSPVAVNNHVFRASRKQQIEVDESQKRYKELVPYVVAASEYPSRYLLPPAPGAESTYLKYRGHPTSERFEQKGNGLPRNHRPEPKKEQDQRPVYARDHAPIELNQAEETLESKHKAKKKPSDSLELSADGDRIQFQIQGHEGPKTYIFGFDTGNGKNRQFRLEERLKDGTVKGHYGYYDARGKLRTIRYLARPFEGYQEKHHEGNGVSAEEQEQN
ncbi:uncharacterized protein LOC100678218 [Nasonia vitripennis]|uniref:Uncharacterized protein n=1 Tax=Nasonia vitripennis TaxID=7425 RepID=A0A7M7GJ90_NASVI|nr:uncharacterized protein LOC100678218 [Nasonia vitripennis]